MICLFLRACLFFRNYSNVNNRSPSSDPYHDDNGDDNWTGWGQDDSSKTKGDITPTNDWGDANWGDTAKKSSSTRVNNGDEWTSQPAAKSKASATNLIDFDDDNGTSFTAASSSTSGHKDSSWSPNNYSATTTRKEVAPKPKTLDDELWESLGSIDIKSKNR